MDSLRAKRFIQNRVNPYVSPPFYGGVFLIENFYVSMAFFAAST